jgi:hypothetical protein
VKETMAQSTCDFKSFHRPHSQLALLMGPRGSTGKVSYNVAIMLLVLQMYDPKGTVRSGGYWLCWALVVLGYVYMRVA